MKTILLSSFVLLLLIFSLENIQFINSQTIPQAITWTYISQVLVDGYCKSDTKYGGDYFDGYVAFNYPNKLTFLNASINGVVVDSYALFNYNSIQFLYLRVSGSPTESSITLDLVDSTTLQLFSGLIVPGFYCTSFINQPLKLKGDILAYNSFYNPRLSVAVFNIEFDRVPIDSLGCQVGSGTFDCICEPYDYSFLILPANSRLFVKCSLSPKPLQFTGWSPVDITLIDTSRVGILPINITVSFPGQTLNTTTTQIESMDVQISNRTKVNTNSVFTHFDLYAKVTSWNNEFISYKSSGKGAISSTSTTYTNVYKPVLGNNDNALIHFALPQSRSTISSTPDPFTNTVISNLTTVTILPSYTAYYPWTSTNVSSTANYDPTTSKLTPTWNMTKIIPFFSFQANSLLGNNIPTIHQPFPFALKSGIPSMANYKYSFDQPIHPNFITNKMSVWSPHRQLLFEILTQSPSYDNSSVPTNTPMVNFIATRRISSLQTVFIYIINYNDGFGYQGAYLPLSSSYGHYLKAGDYIDTLGFYEHEVNITQTNYGRQFLLDINSLSGTQSITYKPKDLITATTSTPGAIGDILQTLSFTANDIIEFYWNPPSVGVTLGPAKSTLYFKLRSGISLRLDERPGVLIYNRHKSDVYDLSQYYIGIIENNYLKVEVTIRQRSYPGPAEYFIGTMNTNITRESIAANPLIGEKNATLEIICQHADEMGPVVGCVMTTSNNSIIINNQTEVATLIWTVNIQDQPSGIDITKSYAIITSDLDPTQRRAELVSISGDSFDGYYNVSYQTRSGPASEKFKLDLVLTDMLGNVANSLPTKVGEDQVYIDPFLYLGIINYARYITVSYPVVEDNEPPILTEFLLLNQLPIDTSYENRTLQFQFTLFDIGTGISLTSQPIIYLNALDGDMVQCIATLVSTSTNNEDEINPSYASYQCNLTLPYGFGFQTSPLISIYGYSDYNRNFGGYTSSDLIANGMIGSFPVTITNTQPLILSTSGIPGTTGVQTVTIRGRRLIPPQTYTYTKVRLFIGASSTTPIATITPSFFTSTVVAFSFSSTLVSPTDNLNIQVTYTYSNGISLITKNSNIWSLVYAETIPYNPLPEPTGPFIPISFFTPIPECPIPIVPPDSSDSSSSSSSLEPTKPSESSPSLSNSSHTDNVGDDSLSGGIIAAIVICSFVGVSLIGLSFIVARKKLKGKKEDRDSKIELNTVPIYVGGKVNHIDQF